MMRRNNIIILICTILFMYTTGSLRSQENKFLKFEIKLNKDQIEQIESIHASYNNDICPGCPEDSCVYCPIFSVNKESINKRININALVKSESFVYKLVITKKDGKQFDLKRAILESSEMKEVINLKQIDFNKSYLQ